MDAPASPPTAPTDEELAGRAAQRDAGAFDEIVARYQAKVYRLTVRMGAGSEAEDVLQETFLQVLRKLDTFRGESRFSTWLFRIAVNCCLMNRRAAARRERIEPLEDCLPRFEESGRLAVRGADFACAARAEELVERAELAERLREAVAALPEAYRLPLVLHDLEGVPAAECASILDVLPATFRTRLHRARLMLRGYLGRLAGGEP